MRSVVADRNEHVRGREVTLMTNKLWSVRGTAKTPSGRGAASKYDLLVLAAATAFDNAAAVEPIRQFVLQGGTLVISPFTAYMDRNTMS